MKTTKLTKIEKKYKDKKTGEYKSMTIEYAKVNDRLLEFRTDNPRGSIVTSFQLVTDRIIFKSHIVKDRGDATSAEATGHATGKDDGTEKVFEKLETIATGRALALLGYGAKGEIASSEEMEEFLAYQEQQKLEALEQATERINACTTLDELKDVWTELNGEMKVALADLKESKKNQLNEKVKTGTKKPRVDRVAQGKDNGVETEGHHSEAGNGA